MGVNTVISFRDTIITNNSHAQAAPVHLTDPDQQRIDKRISVRKCDCAGLYEEEPFNAFLQVEMRRTERSRRPFLLMLIDLEHLDIHEKEAVAKQIAAALLSNSRETDVKGWYKEASVIGIMFTERSPDNNMACFQNMILDKVCGNIKSAVGSIRFGKLDIRLHVFSQDTLKVLSGVNKDDSLCRNLAVKNADKRMALRL